DGLRRRNQGGSGTRCRVDAQRPDVAGGRHPDRDQPRSPQVGGQMVSLTPICRGGLRMNRHLGLAATARVALGLGLVLVAFNGTAFAGASAAPELDAGSMLRALTLLAGGILVASNRLRPM